MKSKESLKWRKNCYNEFQWPYQEVIMKIHGMELTDLGFIIVLEKDKIGREKRVAPAIFYHSKPPKEVKEYYFAFKAIRDVVDLKCSIKKKSSENDSYHRIYPLLYAETPISLVWDSSQEIEGEYDLTIDGLTKEKKIPINFRVTFYHRKKIE